MAYRRNNNRRHHGNRGHRNRENRLYRDYEPTPLSKSPSNVTVRPKPGEYPERTIKRFMKKVKKEKVIENYREKTDYYKKPSVHRRRKAIRRKALLRKQRLLEQSSR